MSAFVWAILGLVPVHDRLALWMVPALYLGIAFCLEGALRPSHHRRAVRWLAAVAAIALVVPLSLNIFDRGWLEYRAGRWPEGNGGMDDRTGIEWLLGQQRAGDIVIATRMSTPALWWYGDVPVGDPHAGRTLADGTPILQAALDRAAACPRDALLDLVTGHRRALMYVGFPDEPAGFSNLLLTRLSRVGTVTAEHRFGLVGHAAVIDLGTPALHELSAGHDAAVPDVPLSGCLVGLPAARW
jgi:hypothetical protein